VPREIVNRRAFCGEISTLAFALVQIPHAPSASAHSAPSNAERIGKLRVIRVLIKMRDYTGA